MPRFEIFHLHEAVSPCFGGQIIFGWLGSDLLLRQGIFLVLIGPTYGDL